MNSNIKKIFTSILICCYLSACFKYSPNLEGQKKLDEARAIKNSEVAYCTFIESIIKEDYQVKQLPEFYVAYAVCLEKKLISTKDQEQKINQMYYIGGQCEVPEAVVRYQSLNEPLPERGCEAGDQFFLCMHDQRCGLSMQYTGAGIILGAPIWIPGAIIITAAVIVAIPICVVLFPILKSRCL